jgi:flagellar biogenesis protein FliO
MFQIFFTVLNFFLFLGILPVLAWMVRWLSQESLHLRSGCCLELLGGSEDRNDSCFD